MNNKIKILSFDDAVHCLQQGGLVLYPTETFFAIGCKAHDEKALKRLYKVKKRPQTRPIPVLAANIQQVEQVTSVSASQKQLVTHFWPGPLTLISKAHTTVPELICANTGKIAVRISSHPLAQSLARSVDDLLVCSSANISGEEPTTDYTQLSPELINNVDGVLLGEPKPSGGLASTLVEVLAENILCVRRHGAVPAHAFTALGWEIGVKE